VDPTWQIVIAVAGLLLSGGVAGVISALTGARKGRVDGLAKVIETLQADYARVVAENAELRSLVAEMRNRVDCLERQVERWQERYQRLWAWACSRGLQPPEDVLNGDDG